jgi:hypothetical protein
MSKQRRKTSLYANISTGAITPDLSNQVVIKIVPDTKIEKALYRMLVVQQRRYGKLLAAHQELKLKLRENSKRRFMRKLTIPLKPQHNPNPKS